MSAPVSEYLARKIKQARERYAMGSNVEIDDEPATSEADSGVWVAAWVWVPNDEDDDEPEDMEP